MKKTTSNKRRHSGGSERQRKNRQKHAVYCLAMDCVAFWPSAARSCRSAAFGFARSVVAHAGNSQLFSCPPGSSPGPLGNVVNHRLFLVESNEIHSWLFAYSRTTQDTDQRRNPNPNSGWARTMESGGTPHTILPPQMRRKDEGLRRGASDRYLRARTP